MNTTTTKILCVDDELGILRVLKTFLTFSGYEVTATQSSEEAAQLIRSNAPLDLMISDIRMRPVSGLDLLQLARSLRPGMPVLMITAYAHEEAVAQAMEMGAVGYLHKPFDTAQLLIRVREALHPSV